MKIGIDCRLWEQTGIGRYTRNLVFNLLKIDRKNKYILFVRNKDLDQVKFQISNFLTIYRIPLQQDKFQIVKIDISWHTIREQVMFPEILKRENLDLMHFPYFSAPIYYNRPFVVTIHDLIQLHFRTGKVSTLPWPFYAFKYLGYKYVILKTSQKARKIIAVSNSTRSEIMDHLKIPKEKIEVIHEGVGLQITNHKLQNKLQITNKLQNYKFSISNTKYFLFVGNVYPHKNTDALLNAFSILLKYYSNVNLLFAGKEDYFYKRLKKAVKKLNLSQNVKFLGDIPDEELSLYYKNAIAEVVPSFMEGFGLPALEAMAHRCVVLASDIPSLKEVCGDNVIYFNPYDENDLAEKMKIVYEGKFDKKIVEKAYLRSQEFSWAKMAKQTLKIYEDSLKKF